MLLIHVLCSLGVGEMGTEQKGLMDPAPVIPIHPPLLGSSVSTPNPAQRLARQPVPAPLPVSAEFHPFSFRLEKISKSSLDFPCFIFLALEAESGTLLSMNIDLPYLPL